MRAIGLWIGGLAVPLLALVELIAHLWIGQRAPNAQQWKALASPVRALTRPGDALIVTPGWAEPIARQVLGDSVWRVDSLARADDVGLRRVVELSLWGAHDSHVADWVSVTQREQGPFTLRVLANPHYQKTLFSAVEQVSQALALVFRQGDSGRLPCAYQRRMPRTGGLHGHVAFPAERYVCGERVEEFVGVTIIDDENFRPRRCVWAEPPAHGSLWINFPNVQFGKLLAGHMGSSYFLMRKGDSAPVELTAFIDGERLFEIEYRDDDGWQEFSTPTGGYAGRRGELSFQVRSKSQQPRQFCFSAVTR